MFLHTDTYFLKGLAALLQGVGSGGFRTGQAQVVCCRHRDTTLRGLGAEPFPSDAAVPRSSEQQLPGTLKKAPPGGTPAQNPEDTVTMEARG